MKLYELIELSEEGQEITVTDTDYEMEIYFENKDLKEMDAWDEAMIRISKLLDVVKIEKDFAVEVNLSKVIEDKIDEFEKSELFIDCDIDSIMDDIENIFAGYVSEKWFANFVEVLEGE